MKPGKRNKKSGTPKNSENIRRTSPNPKVSGPSKKPSVDELFRRIVYEAPLIPGDVDTPCEYGDIPWADENLMREGQQFVRDNRFAVSLAHIAALLYGFSFKPLTSVLLRTGGFGLGDQTKSMLRHVETGLHVNKWYSADPVEMYKDVQIVRKLHLRALRTSQKTPVPLWNEVPNMDEKLKIMEALEKDLDDCVPTGEAPQERFNYEPPIFFSQYDMLMTQFGFIFMMILFPKTIGVRHTQGIGGFLHMWAVLGKLLGIQDQYNLALNPNRDLCLKLFYQLGMASLKDMDYTILHLQQTYIDAITPVFKFMTLKSAFYAGLIAKEALPNFKTDHFYKILSWKDWIYAKMAQIFNFLIYHSDLARNIANLGYQFVADRNDKKVIEAKKKSHLKNQKKTQGFGLDFTKRIWEFIQTVLITTFHKS